jgi:glycine/D-amino acid oxidase-like deaminating enzyme
VKPAATVDYLIIGGGFYGCCLALFLRSLSPRVLIAEAGDHPLTRASRVNQARVHTGFHYPRSPLTAIKSMMLHRRFAGDFPDAIRDDFQMLYAIARRRSKVSAKRFHRMFQELGAPIKRATTSQAALFHPDTVEAAFACNELAFDYFVLQHQLHARLDRNNVDLRLSTQVTGVAETDGCVKVQLSDGSEVLARYVFNVTYAQINHILRLAGLPEAQLKYEVTEIALVRPPEELLGFGVTVMDGPFFSTMPYPAEDLYSLTHVRYTPHRSWTDQNSAITPYEVLDAARCETAVRHMLLDGQRYLPCLAGAEWQRSIFDVKTVLVKNECDDGRPILYQRRPPESRVISVLGGKIDNIYDLFQVVRMTAPEFALADDRLLTAT